jgi:protein TonB
MTAGASLELMKYGGIDLRRNYRKYLGRALALAIGLHIVLLFGFIAAQYFSGSEKGKSIPMVKMRLSDLAPPPSIQQNVQTPVSAAAPIAKPSVGVPVPVPDAEVSPEQTFATLNQLTDAAAPVGDGPGIGSGQIQIEPEQIKIDKEEESPYDFVPVEKEPALVTDLKGALVYPELARRANIEGRVFLRFKVLPAGTVGEVLVEKSDHKIFEEAAIAAIRKCRFTPAIQNGVPITVWTSQMIEFKLR